MAISVPPLGARVSIISKDPSPMMKDIFGDLNPEGHQTNIDSTEAVKGEGEEPEYLG